MAELITTLKKIRQFEHDEVVWRKLLQHLNKTQADDEPLPFRDIVESNGIKYAMWCMRSAPEYDKEWRLFAVWCARQVPLVASNPNSLAVLDVAERFAHGGATRDELKAACRSAADSFYNAAWEWVEDTYDGGRAVYDAQRAVYEVLFDGYYPGRSEYAAAVTACVACAACAVYDLTRLNPINSSVCRAFDDTFNAAMEAQKVEFLRVVS